MATIMTRYTFITMTKKMVEWYGVHSYLDDIDCDESSDVADDELYFCCPECGEPIYYEDFKDSKLFFNACCPICESDFCNLP